MTGSITITMDVWTITFGYDFRYDDSEPMDPVGHGTHVAGTIGAVGNNNSGVTGVMQTVKLMALKAGGVDNGVDERRHHSGNRLCGQ